MLYRMAISMVYNIIIALTYLMSMFISYSFFSQIANKKYNDIHCLLMGFLIFESGALINIFASNTVWLNAVYFAVINTLFAFLCFKMKVSKVIFYSILLDIFNGALEYTTIFLISAITQTKPNIYLEKTNFLILDIIISKTLYYLTCAVLSRFVKKEKSNIKIPIGLFIYPVIVICNLLVFWNICVKTDLSGSFRIILSVLSFALFFSIVILFLIYQRSIEKENELFSLQNELDKIETDKTYYDILEKQNQDLMIYAHDAKKHLSAIRNLNDNPIIEDYVNTMSDALKTYSSSCRSGNHLLDVIINKYETECQLKNIRFSFDIKLCNLDFIENYDLVTILSNLLDNAVRAAENTENAFISLYTHYANTYAVLELSNSCNTPPVSFKQELFTTKGNKHFHGLGIKSVKKTLKKYSGEMEWKYDENDKIFTAVLMILSER